MENNKFKIIFVSFIFLVFIIGGFIMMQISIAKTKEKNAPVKIENKEENKDIRIDKTKEYIYFTNEIVYGDNLDISYKDIVFNFKEDSNLAQTLNDETVNLKSTVVENENVLGKVASAEYKIYEIIKYDNYLSLIVSYYKYDCNSLVIPLRSKTYNFDKTTGMMISNNDLLTKYSITEDVLKDKVKKHLEGIALLRTDIKIDINNTMALLNEYNLYVNKIGKLNVRVLVKNDQNDYNEDVIVG